MSRITRIDINRLHFTTVPDRRVTEISAALDAERAHLRAAPAGSIDADTARRNVDDLEGVLERANVNLQAHTAHMGKLEAERTAQRDEAEKRRQAADDEVKAREKSTFLASNRTASEDDFERLWPAIRDQMMIDQRNDAIAAARASGRYAI
jgi:hypothetical protein